MIRWRRRRPSEVAPSPGSPGSPASEQDIVAALERLRTTTARDVMTPRVDVVALPAPVTTEAAAQAVKESGHSRFPVYAETLDQLVGVLFVKDLFRQGSASEPRLRKPFLIPEGRNVLDLLQEMRQERRAFAVIIDEHGGLEGVLTIKDLVGELVGGLQDEFDPKRVDEINRVDANRWLLDGQASVDRVEDALGITLPDGEYVTVAGFLFDRFGHIPVENEVVLHEGWEFRVSEMDRRRIASVVVRAPGSPPSGNLDATGK